MLQILDLQRLLYTEHAYLAPHGSSGLTGRLAEQ